MSVFLMILFLFIAFILSSRSIIPAHGFPFFEFLVHSLYLMLIYQVLNHPDNKVHDNQYHRHDPTHRIRRRKPSERKCDGIKCRHCYDKMGDRRTCNTPCFNFIQNARPIGHHPQHAAQKQLSFLVHHSCVKQSSQQISCERSFSVSER